jgi:hypothetical protein
MIDTLTIFEESPESEIGLDGNINTHTAINLAEDHFTVGYTHLYHRMASYQSCLQGSDLVYFNEFSRLQGARA